MPSWSSASVFTSDLICHPYYPGATIHPQVVSRSLLIFAQCIAVLPTHLAISVVPHLICCHPTSLPPPYSSLLYRISTNVLVRRSLHSLTCLTSLLSYIFTAHPLLSSRFSVAVLITLFSIIPCTSPPLFVYLLQSGLLLSLRCYILHCLLRFAPHYFSHSPFWYLHYYFLLSFGTALLSLRDFIALLRSAPFSLLSFTPLCSNLIIPLRYFFSDLLDLSLICSTMIAPIMLWSACSDIIWSYFSDLLCLSFLWTF